jgi:hypothetical protein
LDVLPSRKLGRFDLKQARLFWMAFVESRARFFCRQSFPIQLTHNTCKFVHNFEQDYMQIRTISGIGKNLAKILAFFAQITASFTKKYIMTLVLEKNANCFAENGQKSQKIMIITSTQGLLKDRNLNLSPKSNHRTLSH